MRNYSFQSTFDRKTTLGAKCQFNDIGSVCVWEPPFSVPTRQARENENKASNRAKSDSAILYPKWLAFLLTKVSFHYFQK